MSKLEAFISCDPGARGSFCLLVPETKQIAFLPTTTKPIEIMQWFTEIQIALNPKIIMVEKVHSIFGTSAKANFTFGYNVGVVNALAEASGIGIDHVQPKAWQKKLGVTSKGKAIKQEVAGIAERLYPTVNIRGARGGILDGKSDSLCIGHYAYLKYTGK